MFGKFFVCIVIVFWKSKSLAVTSQDWKLRQIQCSNAYDAILWPIARRYYPF